MRSRSRPQNASFLPWQLPALDGLASPSDSRPATDAESGEAAASGTPAAASVAFEQRITTADELAPIGFRDTTIVAERLDEGPEATAHGYAQGLARGLDEGRTRGYAEGHAEGHAAGYAEAFAAGRAEGMAQGREGGQAALAAQARRLASLIERLDAPIPALEKVVEDAVVALALEVARAVVGAEVAQSREFLVRLIREAVAKVPIGMGKPRLVMNFSDLELIQGLASDISEQSVTLVSDDTIEPGGCLVVAHTDEVADRRWHPRASEAESQVDLTLPTRWRAVMRTLFEPNPE